MRQLDRQTISALFVALALVLAIGPAMGLAGASVQTDDDGTTSETADSDAQNATANYTTNGAANHTIQTRTTIDRITIDRISTDYLTVENLTIEGLNTTSTAAGAMFGAAPSDMEGVTVEEGADDAADESDETAGDAGWFDGDGDESEDDAVSDDAEDGDTDDSVDESEDDADGATDDTNESEDDAEDDSDDVEDTDGTDESEDDGDTEDADDAEDGTDDTEDTDDAEEDTDDSTDDAEDDAGDGTDADDGDAEDDEMEPVAPAEPEGDSYNVSDLEAPENATVGDQLTVTAEISNPNEEASNQSVEFRLDGDVVERQYVELDGEENETVTFEIDTEGLEAGDYNHGVLTFDNGEVADISLEAADEEEDDEEEAPVDDGEGAEDEQDDEADAEPNASVTFEDQETNGSTVTVDSVNVSEGGFVTIHNSSLLENETFDSVVGTSEYLDPGEHEDVEVQLYDEETVPGAEFDQDALEENQTLIAMPHQDTNDNETYDFLETEGEEGGPYTEDEEAVTDDAEVTVADDEEEAPVDEGEDEDAETNATLDVQDQSGDGETLSIGEASADEDFYLVARYDGETTESQTFSAVEERLDYTLTLDPPIESDTSVEVALVSAEDDQDLTAQQIEYDVEDDAAAEDGTDDAIDEETEGELNETTNETEGELNETTNETEGELNETANETEGELNETANETEGELNMTDNETDGTTNETDGDATGVTGNETAGLLA